MTGPNCPKTWERVRLKVGVYSIRTEKTTVYGRWMEEQYRGTALRKVQRVSTGMAHRDGINSDRRHRWTLQRANLAGEV